ncbi:MAG: hypothetical protein ACRD3Q_00675 [Terriglobales bacterium]
MADVALQQQSAWVGGLAEWTEGDVAYLSVAFTWKLREARDRARWYRSLGYRVRAGGPATFRPAGHLADVAELGGDLPDAVRRHNPAATIASRGCPVGCWFCIVPPMEGKTFTLLPDFPVRPVLCDNNLSALPADYQQYIVSRYQAAAVPLLDANSGFEPRTFDRAVYERWRPILKGPWRFAFDDWDEAVPVIEVLDMLKDLSPKRKRVYVLIGNEPFAECMARLHYVLGPDSHVGVARKPRGEPHVQPLMKLNALEKEYWVRFDWTEKLLRDVARWANRRIWRYAPFSEYAGSVKSARVDRFDKQTGLFA